MNGEVLGIHIYIYNLTLETFILTQNKEYEYHFYIGFR